MKLRSVAAVQAKCIELDFTDTTTLSLADWLKIPHIDNQRNHEERARTAKHLHRFQLSHVFVTVAHLADGSQIALDGMTRRYVWENGLSNYVPTYVRANIVRLQDIMEARLYYTHFDSVSAVEKAKDKIFGAYRLAGLHNRITTDWIRNGKGLKEALKIAGGSVPMGAVPEYELVGRLKDQIIALDSLNPNPAQFVMPVTAAFLLSHKMHGDKVMPLWTAFAAKDFGNFDEGVNAAGALSAVIDSGRRDGKTGRAAVAWGSAGAGADWTGLLLAIVEKWMLDADRRYSPLEIVRAMADRTGVDSYRKTAFAV